MALLKNLPPSIDKQTFRNCLILFFVLCLLIFGKSISNKYAMDDEFVTLNNAQIHKGFKAIPKIFKTTYAIGAKASYEYRPLVKVTYAIEYQLFGENPHISHFINILLYFFAVSLLFYVMLRLVPAYHYIFALVVSLIFLVHPLHSEVVMSLKNRDVIMSFTFCMLSLLYFLRFAEKRGNLNLVWGAVFILLALLSKRDSLTFFAVIPFALWFFRGISWKKIAFALLAFVPVPLVFHFAKRSVENGTIRTMIEWENPLFFSTSFIDRIPQGFHSVYFYVKMFIVPHPLISYYGYNQIPMVTWATPVVWIVIVSLLILGYFVIKNFSSKAIWIFGIVYFFITISMFTNVVKPVVGIVGERLAFIPSLGLCIVAAFLIFKYLKIPYENHQLKLKTFNNKLWTVLGLIVLVFGARTFARNAAWKDAYTLYKTDVELAPESAHLHTLLAATSIQRVQTERKLTVQEKQKLLKDAEHHYLESLRLLPDYLTSLNNIGMLYYSYFNQPQKSIPYLKKAVQLDTNYVEAYFNLASCQAALGDFRESEKNYRRSLALDPTFKNSYVSLSALLGKDKRFDEVLELNKAALEKGYDGEEIYINIGNAYYLQGDTLQAVPYLEKAIGKNPDNRNLNAFLANFYMRKGDTAKANYYSDLAGRSKK